MDRGEIFKLALQQTSNVAEALKLAKEVTNFLGEHEHELDRLTVGLAAAKDDLLSNIGKLDAALNIIVKKTEALENEIYKLKAS